MQFSVVICTYNRSHNLPGCIERLARQEGVDGLDWEVVVVDNNSTDDTEAVVERLAAEAPIAIRYVFEGEQGLNYARNRGVAESEGGYFCFVDDDILVGPGWLAALHAALEQNDADAVGGRIHLDESLVLPPWIRPDMYGFLGHQDYGDEPFQMDGKERYPFGGNMAFNRRVVDRIGHFNPKLGRKGAGQKRGELFKGAETDYFHRLAKAGGRIYYEPKAVVYHQILPFQITKRYFRTIHSNAGYQKAFTDQTDYPRTLGGIPLFLFPQFARGVGRYASQLARNGPDWAFRQRMTVGYLLGMMRGYAARKQNISASRGAH